MVDNMQMNGNSGMPAMQTGRGNVREAMNGEPANIDLLMDVALKVTVELGRTQMMLRQVLELQHGSVVELDRLAGDPVDIYINERLLARGEVVVVDDKFGVKITELVAPGQGVRAK